ncbi:AraC family transcriptional regulator [Nocardia otitidiscaviarum]|uniref:AraC family transcriptional regulator n=1 Tax=Nocardia otitidiscaviarum TaxID=1823 RepID=UPI00189365BE|nr:AraC family transcriptional regulator [Nocardia otitidiscaviarum]MBF6182884.1 AraC family transcriptional regulator ligand-binding domain-containing protein [Nocardia otitidiscaviarum]
MRQTGRVVKDGRALDPIDGTTSSHLLRLVRDSALRLGADPARVAAIPGTADSVLAGELNRIPLDSLLRLWSLIAETGPGAGLAIAAAAPLGTLTTWDYLVTSGPTLADSLHAAQPYHRLVTAAAEGFDLTHDRDLTVGYRTTAADPEVSAVVNEYVLAYYLRRAREATGRHIIPTRVTFGHPAPPEHSALIDAFGTAAIEFDAPADSITFRAEDAETPLPRADPMLSELLRSHADLVLASARAIPGPLEAFRTALTAAVAAGEPTLAAVARRLAMSTRTLQRHLADHDTTWRAEYDRARYEQARALLAEDRLSMAAIARRLGFTDDRALRKAMRRWTGGTASQLRSEMAG